MFAAQPLWLPLKKYIYGAGWLFLLEFAVYYLRLTPQEPLKENIMTDKELKTLKDNLCHAADVLRSGAHLAADKYVQPELGVREPERRSWKFRFPRISEHCLGRNNL